MKKIRNRVWIFILCALFALLPGCGKGGAQGPAQTGQDLAGFVRTGGVTGGSALENANLAALVMRDAGGDTVLTLNFASESILSGSGAQTEAAHAPSYKVYTLGRPYRLVIEFSSLSYWDYVRAFEADSSALIGGVFNHSPAQGGVFRLYMQLNREAAYRAEEEGGTLTVTLRPIEEVERTPGQTSDAVDVFAEEHAPEGSSFYVLANAYRDYCAGSLSCPEMSPVLSRNGVNVLLISDAMRVREKAEALLQKILRRESNAVEANWQVVLLEDGQLPNYTQEMDYLAAYDVTPARRDGAPVKLDVVIPDGLFLAMTPGREGLLYSRRIIEYEAGGGVTEYERLYIADPSGASRQLLNFSFERVESALYSPDGRKLAVLERSGESAHLYVFDVDSRDLITDLSGMGFGDTVSAYCWDGTGGRIFSIGGSNEIVVNQYDFNVPSESRRYSVVDKKGVDETSLAFWDGEVYFSETSMENGAEMFRVKPEGGLRRLYLAADAFAFSQDNRYLAYTNNSENEQGAAENVFALIDLQTGEAARIQTDFRVYAFKWSADAKTLFYFENMLSGDTGEDGADEPAVSGKDPYPYRLWMYDRLSGSSTAVADLTTTNIGIAASGGLVYVCYVDTETHGEVVRATYALEISG